MNRPYRVLESRVSTRQYDYTPEQWKWLGSFAAFGTGFILIPLPDISFLCLPFYAIGFFGWLRYRSGPGYFVAKEYWDNFALRRRKKRPAKKPKETDSPPINVRIMSLPLKLTKQQQLMAEMNGESTEMGVSYFPPRDTDASMITASGWDAANYDDEELVEEESAYADAVMEAARDSYVSIGYTIGLSSRPLDLTLSRDYADDVMDLRVMASEQGKTLEDVARLGEFTNEQVDASVIEKSKTEDTTGDDFVAAHWQNMQKNKKVIQREVQAFYSLNVPRPIYWPKGDRGDIRNIVSADKISSSPIVTLTNSLAENLDTVGVKGVKILNLDELKTFTRASWDINTVDQWHEGLTSLPNGEEVDPDNPWPKTDPVTGTDENGEYVMYDGTYERVYLVSDVAKRQIFPGEFRSLFAPNAIGPADKTGLVVAMSADTLLASRESKITTRRIRRQKAWNIMKLNGRLTDVSDKEIDQSNQLVRRRNVLDNGGSHALSFNTFVVASGASLEYLNMVDREIHKKSLTLNIKIEVVKLESRSNRAFWTSVLGATMM